MNNYARPSPQWLDQQTMYEMLSHTMRAVDEIRRQIHTISTLDRFVQVIPEPQQHTLKPVTVPDDAPSPIFDQLEWERRSHLEGLA